MKVIIAGSRDITDRDLVYRAVAESGFEITEVVCGAARGADCCGAHWGVDHGVPVKLFHPDWDKHGKAAGPIRNRQMAEYADALILVWDGQSKGSANMLNHAVACGLRVYEHNLARDESIQQLAKAFDAPPEKP